LSEISGDAGVEPDDDRPRVRSGGWSLYVLLVRSDEDVYRYICGHDYRWIECNYPDGSYAAEYSLTRLMSIDGVSMWWNGEEVTRAWRDGRRSF
jgi:hypothetical protein